MRLLLTDLSIATFTPAIVARQERLQAVLALYRRTLAGLESLGTLARSGLHVWNLNTASPSRQVSVRSPRFDNSPSLPGSGSDCKLRTWHSW